MRQSTDLIVAPREAAEHVATTPPAERPWPQAPVQGLYVEELALLHAHLDGVDADAMLPVSGRNPFTGQPMTMPRSTVEYVPRFAGVGSGDDDEADSGRATYACPESFTAPMARLEPAALRALATRWCASTTKRALAQGITAEPLTQSIAEANLDVLRRMAQQAIDQGHVLFLTIRM